ncbi:MAG: preprotein translocase subunit YajC [Proteobacteria bacterium]|nr:preprotein translocase subunit YajC [Pseudomonadota bacterium]
MLKRTFAMTLPFATAVCADTGAAPAGGMAAGVMQFAPFIAIFVLMYFLILRPSQKREKERQAMVSALKRGDRVLTNGGILGVVHKIVNDDEIVLEIADDVRVRFARSAVSQVLSKSEPVHVASQKEDAAEGEASSEPKTKSVTKKAPAKRQKTSA